MTELNSFQRLWRWLKKQSAFRKPKASIQTRQYGLKNVKVRKERKITFLEMP
jgi:hypothetical protein